MSDAVCEGGDADRAAEANRPKADACPENEAARQIAYARRVLREQAEALRGLAGR